MKNAYKVLASGMRSPFQNFVYEAGKEYVCEDFDPDPAHDCSRGFYATGIDGLPYAWNTSREAWCCEVAGRAVEINEFKRRYERIRLLERVEEDELRKLAEAEEETVDYRLAEVLFPTDPRMVTPLPPVAERQQLLSEWASVGASIWDSVWASVWASVGASIWDSVWASVWDSVWDSVWASVRDSVWASVRDSVWASVRASVRDSVRASVRASVWASVRDSVRDSVGAYIGSLFPRISDWRHITHAPGFYPFQAGADLWRAGLVPSFDGECWRLCAGADMAIVHTWKPEE